MKIKVLLLISFILPNIVLGQLSFDDVSFCFDEQFSYHDASVSELYPPSLFDLAEIQKQENSLNDNPLHFMMFTQSQYYLPNQSFFTAYRKCVQSDCNFRSLSKDEVGAILHSDLIIKGRVMSKSNYSDNCLFYKTTYNIQILREFKDNFDFEVGDTVQLKSLIGFAGGCAPAPGLDSAYAAAIDYAVEYEKGYTGLFALSALWYYRVTLVQAKRGSDYEDPICFKYFVDPGQPLLESSTKARDILSLINSVK